MVLIIFTKKLPMQFEIKTFDALPSTNAYAAKLIMEQQAAEGLVISTADQTQGKGHGSNSWESEKGKNLTLSLILQPRFLKAAEQFFITQVVSLALYDIVQKQLPDQQIRIKWPNDLYCGNKKLAGVLIQNFLKGNQINYSVAGIGLNVNQEFFVSDAPNPASMIQFTHKPLPLDALRNELLHAIEYYYQCISGPDTRKDVHNTYMERLYRRGQISEYKDENGVFSGKITDISAFGQLMIEDLAGKTRVYNFKEVEFL